MLPTIQVATLLGAPAQEAASPSASRNLPLAMELRVGQGLVFLALPAATLATPALVVRSPTLSVKQEQARH